MAVQTYPVASATAPYIANAAWINDINNPFDPASISWSEVVSSTPEDWAFFAVNLIGRDGDDKILHVATGAAGAETIIASLALNNAEGRDHQIFYVPIPVTAGSRLSVGFVSTTRVDRPVEIIGYPKADVGADAQFVARDTGPFKIDSSGDQDYEWVQLAAPSSADTFSAWTEISLTDATSAAENTLNGDALAYEYDYIGLTVHIGDVASASPVWHVFQIATGSSGSETVITKWTHLHPAKSPQSNLWGAEALMVPGPFPAGTRIAMRYKTGSLADSGTVTAILSGVRK